MPETLLSFSEVLLFGRELADIKFRHASDGDDGDGGGGNGGGGGPGEAAGNVGGGQPLDGHPTNRSKGHNKLLSEQLGKDARLARIYGFSYEGAFYDLPAPAIFVVHGEGSNATSLDVNDAANKNKPGSLASRAPNDPDLSGVAAADFQIADDIRVWPYDKADYSIRMDVLTGQLEQILLDVYFEFEAPALAGGRVAGGRIAGGRVAGGRVAGGRVAGGRVAGGRVSGGRVSGSGD